MALPQWFIVQTSEGHYALEVHLLDGKVERRVEVEAASPQLARDWFVKNRYLRPIALNELPSVREDGRYWILQ